MLSVTVDRKLKKVGKHWYAQGWIQSVTLEGAISVTFGSQVSLRVPYCKRDKLYFATLLRQNNRRQNGLISRMLFSDFCKSL